MINTVPAIDPAKLDWEQVVRHSDNLIILAKVMNKERWSCRECGSHQLQVREYHRLDNLVMKCRECSFSFYKRIEVETIVLPTTEESARIREI